MAEPFSRGQGQYVGTYPVIESDLSRMLGSSEKLAEIIGKIFAEYGAERKSSFANILEAIKLGILDPNEALVQGTPGGALYKRFLGIEPPSAPMMETVRGQREVPFTVTGPPEDEESFAGSMLTPTTTTRRIGGFQPQSIDQLKQYLIRERLAGRQVDPNLEQYAGFAPKSLYQLAVTNPEMAAKLESLKKDPARQAAFVRLYNGLIDKYPTANPLDVFNFATEMFGQLSAPAGEIGKIARPELGPSKGEMAYDIKNKTLAQNAQIWADKKARGERIDSAKEQKDWSSNWFSIFNTLIKGGIGADLAPSVADIIVTQGPDGLDDTLIGEELKKRVKVELNRKKVESEAKLANIRSSIQFRGAKLDLDERKYATGVEEFNARIAIQDERAESQSYIKQRDALLKSITSGMASYDRDVRTQANALFVDFVVEHLGVEELSPSGFQGFKEALGKMFGVEGLGRPGLVTKPAPEQKPFNVPRIVPKKLGEGLKPPKPKTLEEWKKKFIK